ASTTTVRSATGLFESLGQEGGTSFGVLEPVPLQGRRKVVSGDSDAGGQLAELAAGDLLPAVGFEGKAEESGAKLSAPGGVIGFRKTEEPGDSLPVSGLFLGEQHRELGLRQQVQVAQTIERRGAADAEMMRQEHHVIDLHPLRSRLGSGLRGDGGHAVEDFEAFPARLTLSEVGEEIPDAFLRHEETGGEGVGSYLGQLVAIGGAAQGAPELAVEEHVSVLMDPGETAAQQGMPAVHHHEEAVGRVHQGEPGDVFRQVEEGGAYTLAPQKV